MAGVITSTAYGQDAIQKSVLLDAGHGVPGKVMPYSKSDFGTRKSGAAHRGTVGGGRWYSYVNDIFNVNVATTANLLDNLWNDTSSIDGYMSSSVPTYYNNSQVSVALGFQPWVSAWNSPIDFPGEIAMTTTNAYTIDSVVVLGTYGRKIGTTYNDTLTFAFVSGDGSTGSNMPTGTFSSGPSFIHVGHDSINNRAGNFPKITTSTGKTATPLTYPSSAVYKFLLTPTDTVSYGNMTNNQIYPRTASTAHPRAVPDPVISYAVPAGSMAAMSVSFKSGSPTYPSFPGRDTVEYADGTYKHGGFTMLINFAVSSGTTAIVPPVITGDNNFGYSKREVNDGNGWDGDYLPHTAWLGASSLQYPIINYHIQCPTCATTGTGSLKTENVSVTTSVNAYPNPANNEVTIAFLLNQKSTASVTLSNLVGQVISTQSMENVSGGNFVFGTTNLANGVYLYTFQANNGERTTGRIVVSH